MLNEPLDDHPIENRVGRLEGVVELMAANIQEVTRNISVVGKDIGDLREVLSKSLSDLRDVFSGQLEKTATQLTNATKPQWQSIASFVAIIVVMLGMAGGVVTLVLSGQGESIADTRKNLAEVNARLFIAQDAKGKSDATASFTAFQIASLSEQLQREQKLVATALDTRIVALDTKLQLELELIRRNLDTTIQDSKDQIIDLRAWRLKHATEDAERTSKLAAESSQLQDAVKTLDSRQWEYRVDRLKLFEDNEIKRTTKQP